MPWRHHNMEWQAHPARLSPCFQKTVSRTGSSTTFHLSAILTSPESLGCTPSHVSDEGLNPVNWSTNATGDWIIVFVEASLAISWLRVVMVLNFGSVEGMICANRIFTFGLTCRSVSMIALRSSTVDVTLSPCQRSL